MMNVLHSVVAPPAHPLEVPAVHAWESFEESLGSRLPEDYKQYIEQYGSGGFDGFVWILNPNAREPFFNLIQQGRRILDADRELRQTVGAHAVPYRLFPELGGILPFAVTANGDVLYWKAVDTPDNWTVVARTPRDFEQEEFKTNMTSFIADVLSRRVRCGIFPEDFPSATPCFQLPAYLRAAPNS